MGSGTNEINKNLVASLIRRMERLASSMEKASIAEYVELFRSPLRLIYLNFISGVVRGFGIAVGFSVVGAVFLYFLGRLAELRLPFLGQFVADIVRIVQIELGRGSQG